MTKIKPKSKQKMPKNAKRVFKGVIFDAYQWKQKMFDGSYASFERIKRPDTTQVIPVTADGKIIVLDHEQPGSGRFYCLPGGRIDKGESTLAAAKRELLEETGYKAKKFILWDAIQPVNKIEWSVYTYIAKGCRKVSEPNLDSGEKGKLMFYSFNDFIDLIFSKKFRDKELAYRLITDGLRSKNDKKKLDRIKKIFLS